MIVKNEAPVILRCIDSLRSIIDHWIIVDTGSTDGTQDIIRASLAEMPGALVERPWVNFAHNRTEALNLARPHADYTLVIDADDELIIPAGFVMPVLDAPGYTLEIHDKTTLYSRVQLFQNAKPWHYRGVLHEFAECKDLVWTGTLPLAMRRGQDGARHRDETTYMRDAEILEKALKTEKDPFLIARYTFYLAQSYRDCSEKRKAIKHYLTRAELGFWTEEIYCSFLSAGLLMEALDEPFDQVVATLDRAIAVNPRRVEARFHASRYCRDQNRYVEGYHYANDGISITLPADGLFLQPWMYSYGIHEILIIHALKTGQFRSCLFACITVLGSADFPAEDRPRCVKLARKALVRMVDPAWGAHNSAYIAELSLDWPPLVDASV